MLGHVVLMLGIELFKFFSRGHLTEVFDRLVTLLECLEDVEVLTCLLYSLSALLKHELCSLVLFNFLSKEFLVFKCDDCPSLIALLG